MKRMIRSFVIAAFFGSGVNAFSEAKEKRTVSIQDAYRMIQAEKKNTNFVLLDVRTPDEFKTGHIEGAVNMNFYAEDFREELNQLDKSKKILLYCRTGNRSGKTLAAMEEMGFREVYNMSGGISSWILSGYAVIR